MDVESRLNTVLLLLVCVACPTALVVWMAPDGVPAGVTAAMVAGISLLVAGGALWTSVRIGLSVRKARTSSLMIGGLVAVGLSVRAGLDLRASTQLSQDLIRPAPELGPGGKALIPNLTDAESVVPNRPHHPDDVNAADRLDRFSRLRRFTASTNALGMRGRAFEMPAPGYRILCIGDSVTFGWGVPDHESYPAHLERTLNVEVLNAGMPASKPSHMARWLEINAHAIDADLVILAARPHWAAPDPFVDYQRAIEVAEAAIAPARLVIVLPPVSTFDPMGVRDRFKEVDGLKRVLGGRPFLELTPIFWGAQTAPGVVMESEGQTQRMVRLPDRTIVVEAPSSGDRLAEKLVDAFEADHSLAEPLFFDGGHPDARGNELFAKSVAKFLIKRRLVPVERSKATQQPAQ